MTQCDRSVAMTGWHEELSVAKYRNFITFHIQQSIHHIDLDREPSGSLTIQSLKMILKYSPVAFWGKTLKDHQLPSMKICPSYPFLIFRYLIYGLCGRSHTVQRSVRRKDTLLHTQSLWSLSCCRRRRPFLCKEPSHPLRPTPYPGICLAPNAGPWDLVEMNLHSSAWWQIWNIRKEGSRIW